MNKSKKKLLSTVVIIVILAVAGLLAFKIAGDNNSSSNNSASQQSVDRSLVDKNSSEYMTFNDLQGEDYDRMFLSNMIEHHNGAVNMAKLAIANAKHQELKDMANDIITAQTNEVADMQAWQKDWGYPASSGEMMMDHSAMGMATDMDTMTKSLEGLSGDTFDQEFLSAMISHHQSAINMSAPGRANASHQEIKDLSEAIINAQTKEIAQMKQWQQAWGYSAGESM